jgi:hypothetical protein
MVKNMVKTLMKTWGTQIVLALFTLILALSWGGNNHGLQAQAPAQAPAQTLAQAAQEATPISPIPGSATEYKPPTPSPSPTPTTLTISPTASPTPNPTASPTANPTASPTPGLLPPPVAAPNIPQIPTAPTMPAAPPLPTAGEYQDPSGRFRVAILQGFTMTPIAGTALMEAKDGSLAYTTLAQPAPASFMTPDMLAEIAKTTFQKGEGFQIGSQQPIPGGLRLDWNGELTIGGQTQPVNGIIVAKPAGTQVLLLLITATEKGAEKVPNAAAALIDSLQAM